MIIQRVLTPILITHNVYHHHHHLHQLSVVLARQAVLVVLTRQAVQVQLQVLHQQIPARVLRQEHHQVQPLQPIVSIE